MSILVTGGTGYIGSHTVIELVKMNKDIIIIDNLCNSYEKTIDVIEKITNVKVKFYKGDIRDIKLLDKVFTENKIQSVIHFASLKAVGESVEKPLEYYDNNLIGAINILKTMKKFNVKNFVFSSSATVYGEVKTCPIDENFDLKVTNPYGNTKLIIENMLKDVYYSDNTFNIAILRYFNPVGAHKSHLISEETTNIPNNIVPYIVKVANKEIEYLSVFGNDYDTHDGTGVRDYIHVVDLAKGHIKALNKLKTNCGLVIYNLGTGKGYSVLELIETFKKVNNVDVPYKITKRRKGDIGECYANVNKAEKELKWKAKYNIEDMCKDAWLSYKNKK